MKIALLGLVVMLPGLDLQAQLDEVPLQKSAASSPASITPLLAPKLPGPAPRPIAGTDQAPSGPGSDPNHAEAGPKPGSPPRPHSIRELTEHFNTSREQVLRQRELERKLILEKLRSATGEERTRLIAEYREKQRAWLDEQKSLAEEFRLRLDSIRDEFKNRERDQLFDEVKGKVQDVRQRLGKD